MVEDYPTPEALAERVKEDLWKLIDEAFPASEVPDALAQERMRHEAFAASRLGLYIGGEKYFETLDAAISEEPCNPVLVCGASGGGKSALLANWAQRFSSAHPESIVLTHFLGTGADAAHPVNMAIRLLREMARITGEEFVLEGDPRKALRMLGEWFEKAGAFARERGGVFVLVLDALDKMTEHRDLDWWPRKLPEGVAIVASCLDGDVRDTIARRMEWTEVRVSPLEPMDCERFMEDHLAKYRKAVTLEQKALILAHPLCGNPLFLRTLLEELRVFGLHEELNRRLQHYLASETIDDLFEKVLDRIESDNTPETVRAALEVLWAAKESFAEDELLTVSQLPPAVWAPIHIALDESLIGAGGRLAFSHDYLRKAVEDRYLNSEVARQSIQKRMAGFCVQAMAGGRKEISRYVRRHAVEHFLEVEDWDNATAALSDLEFIEARAIDQELPEMLKDYAQALNLLPEGEKERQTEATRQAELDRYAKEMYEYSAAWSRIRDGSGEPEPILPRPVESVRIWTEEEIAVEFKRMTETPNRLDIVKAFRVFVATNSAPLQQCSTQEGFAANLARNDAPAGPVHEEGKRIFEPLKCIKLIKQFATEEIYNPLPACQAVLEGHTSSVEAIILSADGRRIFSSSVDELRVWDMENGECLKVLEDYTDGVASLMLSVDGRRLVSGNGGAVLRVWNMESGECSRVLEGHSDIVWSLALSADGRRVVSGSEDEIRVWDVDNGECLMVLEGHTERVDSLMVSSDGKQVFSASYDSTLRVWDMESGECLKVLKGHRESVWSLALSIDGRRVVSGSEDEIRVWDVDSGECLLVLEGHKERVVSLSLTADGRRVVSGSYDKTIRIWDIESGACVKVLEGHTNFINSLVLSADGRLAASGSDDKTLRVWDLISGKCLKVLEGHSGKICSIVLSADGRNVVSGGIDNTLRVWDIERCKCLGMPERHGDTVCSLIVSGDRRRVASSSADKTLRIWDMESGKCVKVLEGNNRLESPLLTADGTRVVSTSDSILRVWDTESGECLKVLKGHKKKVVAFVLTADGTRVVSGSWDNTIRVWDVENGECLKVLEGHEESVDSLSLTADRRRVVSGSGDKTIRIWEMESGKCVKVLVGHTNGLKFLSMSADGTRVVSGSWDNTIRVWNVESGKCLKVLEGHTAWVTSHAVSCDGRRIVSGSWDKTLRVWDIKSGACLKTIEGYTDGRTFSGGTLELSGDGRRVVSDSGGEIRVWNMEQGKCHVFFIRGQSARVLHSRTGRLVVGFADGRVEFYNIENLPLGPFITTAQREIISEDFPAGPVTARPACCGQLISIPSTIADRIEHWALEGGEGGEGGYTDPDLLLDCPSCATPLRMNPFFVNIQANN